LEKGLEEFGEVISEIDEFMHSLRLCLTPTFCKYDDKFYEFSDGVPMGSPLAPLISEVFMDYLEGQIFSPMYP